MVTRPLSAADTTVLHLDADTHRMVVTGVLSFAGTVDWSELLPVLLDRLLRRFPRFSQRVVEPAGGLIPLVAGWRDVDVDPAAHVTRTRLAPPGDRAALAEHVGRLLSDPLDPERPLWHLHLLDGYREDDGVVGHDRVADSRGGGTRSVLVARLHHAIADGMALGEVLLGLTDQITAAGSAPAPPEPSGPGTSGATAGLFERALGAGSGLAAGVGLAAGSRLAAGFRLGAELVRRPERVLELPREALGGAATLARLLALPADPPSPLRGPLQVEKRAAWCRPVDLDRVKRLARSTGGTVNDVLLAVAAGALRRHVLLQGGQPNDLRVGMPVNLRGPGRPVPSELGNHFGLVLLTLPLSEADPVERVRLVTAESRRFKAGRDAVFTAGLMNAAGLLPRSVTEAVLNSLGTRCSAIVTNVPGPTSSVSIAGAEVSEIVFWVPQLAGIAVGVSVFSYAGRVSLGVAADATVLPRPQAVADAMAAELDAMDAALVVDLDADPDPGTAGRDAGSLAMRRQA